MSVRAGELLAAGSSLGTLLDESGRELVFQVPASAQAQIRVGAVATWLDAQGVASQGTIARIDAQVEASAGTLEVVAKPDQESAALLMGLRVMGEIELRRTPTGILVPEQAVLRRLDAQVVLVVRDGKATNVPVRVLGRHGGLAAIEGDVHEHEQVIVEGGYNLPEGAGVVLRSGQ